MSNGKTFEPTTLQLPYTEDGWRLPGYTGFVPGVQEVYKKTPIASQLETKQPDEDSFIFTRTVVPAKATPSRDPCNDPSNFKKPQPGNLWPALQNTAVQDSFKPPASKVALGDSRIDVFRTSYHQDFKAPFLDHERLRSPNRNEDLAKTTASLKAIYASAYNRVGDKRLQKMISTMRERMEAKMGNSNNNAFKFRRLFQMYDSQKTGMVHYEDFRNMCETFGMQLDDDSLLSLFHVYDPEGTGYLAYHDLARQLMDPDCYALYVNDVDLSQGKVDETMATTHLHMLRGKYGPLVPDLLKVFKSFDQTGSGYLSKSDLLTGCAGLGWVLSEKEQDMITKFVSTDPATGKLSYESFCSLFQ